MADDHRHRWESQPAVFMQNSLDNWVAVTEYCNCGAVRGYTPNSDHEEAAKIAYTLERAGDLFLTHGEMGWLAARRTLCPLQEEANPS